MQNNFHELIRKNFYIALQPNQVIKSTTKNFGLKSNLHKNLIKFQFNKPIKHGQQDYEEILRFLELGLHCSVPSQKILENDYYFKNFKSSNNNRLLNLSYKPMSEWNTEEFKEWVKHCSSKSKEFQELVKMKKMQNHEYSKFVGLDLLQKETSVMPMNYLAPSNNNEEGKKVRGRIIGIHDSSTLLVGVQGFVCKLESINIPPRYHELRKYLQRGSRLIDLKKEYDFYILESNMINNNNQLNVKLSLHPRKEVDVFGKGKSSDNDVILDKIMNMIKQSK